MEVVIVTGSSGLIITSVIFYIIKERSLRKGRLPRREWQGLEVDHELRNVPLLDDRRNGHRDARWRLANISVSRPPCEVDTFVILISAAAISLFRCFGADAFRDAGEVVVQRVEGPG